MAYDDLIRSEDGSQAVGRDSLVRFVKDDVSVAAKKPLFWIWCYHLNGEKFIFEQAESKEEMERKFEFLARQVPLILSEDGLLASSWANTLTFVLEDVRGDGSKYWIRCKQVNNHHFVIDSANSKEEACRKLRELFRQMGA